MQKRDSKLIIGGGPADFAAAAELKTRRWTIF